MNNVKTRFVIAISQKLSAAPDSEAKVDLIEELSENLYGRYQDMVADGMTQSEAYTTALDKLGDVNELLAYLDFYGKDEPRQQGAPQGGTADDWFNSLGGMIQQTVKQAVDAANDAAAMVRDQFRDFEFNAGSGDPVHINRGGKRVLLRTDDNDGELEFPSEGLRGISVNIVGDLAVYLSGDPDAPIWLRGDTEDLLVEVNDGVITVTQDKSAGGSFFFSRGLSSASIELTIPRRHWEQLEISTTNGDVDIHDGVLEADAVCIKTVSGDMELDSLEVQRMEAESTSGDLELSGVKARRLEVTTTSGDLRLTGSECDELLFHSTSGDLEATDVTAAVLVETISGDVSLNGTIRALKADSASGDLELLSETPPETLELSTKSGDCCVHIPDSGGFIFRFHTVSGQLCSDFPLTSAGPQRAGRSGRVGEAHYKDGGDGRVFSMSSVSGNIELRKRHDIL